MDDCDAVVLAVVTDASFEEYRCLLLHSLSLDVFGVWWVIFGECENAARTATGNGLGCWRLTLTLLRERDIAKETV